MENNNNAGYMSLRILIIPLAFLISINASTQEIQLGTGMNPDPPYVNEDFATNNQLPGITIEILNIVQERLDLTINIKKKPWVRVVEDIKHNRLDGGFHFSYFPARNEYLKYPIMAGEANPARSYALSVRSDMLYRLSTSTLEWDGINFKKPGSNRISLGVIRGGAFASKVNQNRYDLIQVSSNEQLLQLLIQGRVDGIVGLDSMINHQIKTLPLVIQEQIKKDQTIIAEMHFFLVFSNGFYKKNKELVWAIWSIIEELNKNDEFKKIYEKYKIN